MSNEKKYVIIFHNKTIEFIDEKMNTNISNGQIQGARGIVRPNGTFLPFGAIADIETLDGYYAKFPDARPNLERTPDQIAKEREYYQPIEFHASKRQQSFKKLLIGLKKFVERERGAGNPYQNALALYRDKLQKYVQLFGKDNRTELEKLAEDFGGEVV